MKMERVAFVTVVAGQKPVVEVKEDELNMGWFRVWYQKTGFSNMFNVKESDVDVNDLEKTHTKVANIRPDLSGENVWEDLENIFMNMQGHLWGEDYVRSNDLLEELGLHHTSMSVGDIVQTHDRIVYLCMKEGFIQVNEKWIVPFNVTS
jgi:hypothetical protein|tara:strand:- start:390 stop:836 length:447 start_codon:yes stop_codon:yes gene_type:complete